MFKSKKYAIGLPMVLAAAFLMNGARPTAVSRGWASTYGRMSNARSNACAALLQDGRVLITGGVAGNVSLTSSEIFDQDARFTPAASMMDARSDHACAVLPDGSLMVAGGRASGGGILNSSEIYDPAKDTWKTGPTMLTARAGATFSTLQDGRILLAGGDAAGMVADSLEIYDPAAGAFSMVSARLSSARKLHAAAVLDDGRVLFAGGSDGANLLDTLDLFDPQTGKVSPAGTLSVPRAGLTASALLGGRIVLIGGAGAKGEIGIAEVFDPKTGKIAIETSMMSTARQGHIAIRVPDNNSVLIVGGTAAGQAVAQTEIYIPWQHTFQPAGDLESGRAASSGTALRRSGKVVIAGGFTAQATPQATAETSALPTITTDKADYAPGTPVIFSGSNWYPGGTVKISMTEEPYGDQPSTITIQVDALGNLISSSATPAFAPDINDIGVKFYVTATQTYQTPSGGGGTLTAQTVFTDGDNTGTPFKFTIATTVTSGSFTSSTAVFAYQNPGGKSKSRIAIPQPGTPVTQNANPSTPFSLSSISATGCHLISATIGPTPPAATTSATADFSQVGQGIITGAMGLTKETATLTLNFVCNLVPTTTTITSVTPEPSYVGQAYTVNFTVASTTASAILPTGTVTVSADGGETCTSSTLTSLGTNPPSVQGSCVLTTDVAGTTHLQAAYGGDTIYGGSQSILVPHSVISTTSSTTLTSSANPSTYGQPVTFTATIGHSSGTSVPTGSVIFYIDNVAQPAVTVTGGIAQLQTSTLSAGSHTVTASYSGDSNYNPSGDTLTQVVNKVTLTGSADNKSRAYGAADPAFTVTLSGFLNGDTQSVFTGTPACSAGDSPTSPVGTYTITCTAGTLSSTNYSVGTISTGTLTITAAPLTGTVSNASRAFGAANPATVPVTYTGFVNGETSAIVTGTLSCTSTATATSPVSGTTYPITCSGQTAPNYTITYVDGTLTITGATLTGTVGNASRAYGAANPSTATVTYTGFVNGDTSAIVTGTLSCSSTAAATSPVSGPTYPLTCSGQSAPNYTINYIDGALSVTPAGLTGTVGSASRTYGAANPTTAPVTYTGFVNGETSAIVTGTLACTSTATATSPVSGATYPITCSGQTAPNYTITYVDGTLSITPAPLTGTAANASRAYGAANPTTVGVTYTGFVNGETSAIVTGTLSCASTATATSPVSGATYPITCSGQTAPNYTINYVDGTLSITPASLTGTVGTASRTYGAANPTTAPVVYTGFVNSETSAIVTGTLSCTSTATASSPVSGATYPITCSGQTAPNYTITYVDGTLSITPASLTGTVGSASRPYGAANPTTAPVVYTGFVNSETSAIVTGTLSCASTATVSSPVSGPTYPLTCSGQTAPNYSITYVDGTLSITPASLTGTVGAASRPYGAANPTTAPAVYTGFVNGETPAIVNGTLACTSTATTASPVSGATYPITCSGQTAPNYTITYTPGTLSITPASLTGTVGAASRPFGAANPTTAPVTYTGFVNGETAAIVTGTLTCTSTATSTSPISGATYPINCSGQTAPNYTITYTPGTLTITPAGLTGTVGSASRPYGAANPTTVGITYTGFVNGDTSAIVTGALVCTTTATPTSPVSGVTYPISCSGQTAPNYTITYVDGALSITPAGLTGAVGNLSRAYGAPNPTTAPVTYTGFVNGESSGIVTGTLSCTSTATATSPVSGATYPLTCSGQTAPNYTITYTPGVLSITPAPLTATVTGTQVYGGGGKSFSATFATFVNGETSSKVSGTLSCSTSATATSPVGTYTISNCSGLSAANYTISYSYGAFNVTPKSASVTPAAASKYALEADPVPLTTGTLSGFLSSDNVSAAYSRNAGEAAGTYTINATLSPAGVLTNYNITYNTANFTINLRPTKVTYTGSLTGSYGDCAVTVSGLLMDVLSNQPIGNMPVDLAIGTQHAGPPTPMTGNTGTASGVITLSQDPGVPVSATATFAATATYAASSDSKPFTIGQDTNVGPVDGQATYTGSLFFWTTSSSSSTSTLTLSATIRDTDGCRAGDIRKAKVTFGVRNSTGGWSPIPSAQNLPVGLVDPADPSVGTATAIAQWDIGNANTQGLEIVVVIGGNYFRNTVADDKIVTISKPGLANSLVGGGDMDLTSVAYLPQSYPVSSGYLATARVPGAEGYLHIYADVNYNKSGTNPQGDATLLFTTYNKPDGSVDTVKHTYLIKSSSISELTLQGPGQASFGSKAVVQEVTNPGKPVSIDGGATLQITLKDGGSGSYDMVAVSVQKKSGGVWISAAWDGVKTVQKPLVGGNVAAF